MKKNEAKKSHSTEISQSRVDNDNHFTPFSKKKQAAHNNSFLQKKDANIAISRIESPVLTLTLI
jgi:hypothetical protein